ncbi:acyltransferase family protein [Massilia sp. TWR1-2-2]|uniref:acyltransferase family protein n=1 Tax=Massilia sp. TWR1-2-2 TaxID=2804584 RepID=UPI003CE9F772
MKNIEVKKFASLQILRAVAAWTVVYHHVVQLYFRGQTHSSIETLFAKYGDLGVDIFFVLSGFVMHFAATKTKKAAGSFLIDRIFRIAPVYWFYSFLLIACMLFFPQAFAFTDYTAKTLASSLLFIPHLNPSGLGLYPVLTVGWTLNFEMFFYVSLALCMAITAKRFFTLLCIVFLVLPIVYPSTMVYGSIASSFMLYEFLAGFCLALAWTSRTGERFLTKHHRLAMLLGVSAVVGGAWFLIFKHIKLPIAVSAVALALLCERFLDVKSAWVGKIVRLGDESYSTYLAHVIVIGIAIHLAGKELIGLRQGAMILAITVAVWAVSRLSYHGVERNVRLEHIRRRILGRMPGPTSGNPTTVAPVVPVLTLPSSCIETVEPDVLRAVPVIHTPLQPQNIGVD